MAALAYTGEVYDATLVHVFQVPMLVPVCLHATDYEARDKSIAGTVLSDAGVGAARDVFVFTNLGRFVGKTTSSASTGAYSIAAPNRQCMVVCLDDAAGTQHDALIHDKIQPV